MNIIPAIDIKNGKCVRLYMGDFNKETVYFENPIKVAIMFEEKKYTNLHIVDLDGALNGELINVEIISKLKKDTNLIIQYGGGIRTFEKAEMLMKLGIDRIIIGTMAIKKMNILKKISNKYGKKIIIALDVKNDYIFINAWKEKTDINIEDKISDLIKLNISNFLITDISRDGTLKGPNIELYERLLKKFNINIIASGGVSSIEDIKKLEAIGIKETVVGKALYENNLELEGVNNDN
ncbi:MAG: 1-(5-phosphoribosyl)-5-[(5-phosphoribosylamino)methylideneamino]imidazole-4-carboxamide isomerase [Bacillota bacterium]|nr:1-(5-phosphoribosyl)-5-[(5-phosphoribosylamino)methylideneamino]imidazole-4-carboxamide isomerase [Bacillota bacterium]